MMTSAEGIALMLNSYEGSDWWSMFDMLADRGDIDMEATRAVNREGELRNLVLTDHSRVEFDPDTDRWHVTNDADRGGVWPHSI
jgi:hypothetical protein